MPGREAILEKIRSALRRETQAAGVDAPETYLRIPEMDLEARIERFTAALENLAGTVIRVSSPAEAGDVVAQRIGACSAVASGSSFLRRCGILDVAGVRSSFANDDDYRSACAQSAFGVTSADYALAETGSLVMLTGHDESRLPSLLPPAHIAVVPVSRLLSGLDELLARVPAPADQSSAMILITGPSRTADIEQILVRGVHGPGQITVILVNAE